MSDCKFCTQLEKLKSEFGNDTQFSVGLLLKRVDASIGKYCAFNKMCILNRKSGFKLNFCPECGKDLRSIDVE